MTPPSKFAGRIRKEVFERSRIYKEPFRRKTSVIRLSKNMKEFILKNTTHKLTSHEEFRQEGNAVGPPRDVSAGKEFRQEGNAVGPLPADYLITNERQ